MQPETISISTFSDIIKFADEHAAQMDRVFSIENEVITINEKYLYQIELSRIPDYQGLLEWVDHLCGKGWMRPDLIREFVRRVCAEKGWGLYRHL